MTKLVPSHPLGLAVASARATDAIETAIGGRDHLLDALHALPATEEQRYVFGLIADPTYADWPLSKICTLGGIAVGDLLGWYRTAALAKAQILAIHHTAEGLPAVAADVMARARSYLETCPRCDGAGTVLPRATKAVPEPPPVACPKCRGTGDVEVVPDVDRQKVALELGGLLTKGPGVVVAVQQNTGGGAAGTRFGALMADVDAVVEGQVVRPTAARPEAPSDAGPAE